MQYLNGWRIQIKTSVWDALNYSTNALFLLSILHTYIPFVMGKTVLKRDISCDDARFTMAKHLSSRSNQVIREAYIV